MRLRRARTKTGGGSCRPSSPGHGRRREVRGGRDYPAPRHPRGLASVRPRRYGQSTDASNGLDFRILGPLQVVADGTLLSLGGAKQRAVLALLLLHANEVVSSDRLIDELWGESPPESAANMLQGYVSHLRKTLEPGRARGEHELLVSRPPGYMLQIQPDQLDAERFERLTTEGRELLERGDATAAAERIRAALALWRGPAMADLAYEAFAKPHADRVEELRLVALEDRIDADLQLARHDALVGELRELVEHHPLRERLRAQLMAALYRCGRQADALEVYRDGRRVLLDELGIEPGPALRQLEQAILRQDPALGAPAPPRVAIATKIRRRWPLFAGAAVLVGAALAAVLASAHSGSAKPIVVKPHSVVVIDPGKNGLVKDIPVGAYPGPLAADAASVYVCNIGDATVTTIDPDVRRVSGNFSLSRAIDLVAVNHSLWAANGGIAGHTPYPPGSVVDFEFGSALTRTFRLGPPIEGNEEQTTIAADPGGAEIWAGNADSETVTQLEPPTMYKIRGLAPGGLAVVSGRRGDTVWASDPSRNIVARFDGASRRITHRIPVPRGPTRIVAGTRAVWVIARDHNGAAEWRPTRRTAPTVWRIDPKTNRPVARIPLPLTPIRIALGAGSVWVTAQRVLSSSGSSIDATVFRIDPATNRIVARIPLRTRAADGIIVSHGLVWVAIPQSQQ
jgi:DNA-binding SARP family transcriptional activator/DNA-binding beta-propeller fold protein YncE